MNLLNSANMQSLWNEMNTHYHRLLLKYTCTESLFYFHSFHNKTLYTISREPLMGNFYNNSRGKMGKQKVCDKPKFIGVLETDWIGKDCTPPTSLDVHWRGLSSNILMTLHKLWRQFYWTIYYLTLILFQHLSDCNH